MIYFDPITNRLFTFQDSVTISHRDTLVLKLLLEHSPEVVDKQCIIDEAWESRLVGETSLPKSISGLRRAFLKLGVKESPIATVPRVGYRLLPGVIKTADDHQKNQTAPDISSSAVSGSTPPASDPAPAFTKRRVFSLPLLAALKSPTVKRCLYATPWVITLVAFTLLGLKFHLLPLPATFSHQPLTEQHVGDLMLLKPSCVKLTLPLRQLLASNQCDCVVFVDNHDNQYEVSWFHRASHDALNVVFQSGQYPIAEQEITRFVKERE